MWMFGATNEKFQNINTAMVTQFEMLVGEYPWPESDLEQNFQSFLSYLVIYALVIFIILMNFLLAIVVDSYAKVKEEVKECVIECSIMVDVIALLIYPWFQLFLGWPSRSHLIRKLLALDVNFDFVNDEEEAPDSVLITEEALVKGHIFPSRRRATHFMRYFLYLAPELNANKPEEPGSLEHQRKFSALRNLDVLRERLLEAAITAKVVDIYRPPKHKEALTKQMDYLRREFDRMHEEIMKDAVVRAKIILE